MKLSDKCRIAEDDSDVSEYARLCSANWRQSRSIVINQAHAMLPRRWEGTSIMEYGQSFGRDLVAGICAAAMMSMSSIAHAVPVNGLRDPAFRYIYGSYATGGDCSREPRVTRSEEHTSELQSLMRSSYAVFVL